MDTREAGRLGGKARAGRLSATRKRQISRQGGKARSRKLSKARRREIGRKGAAARWTKFYAARSEARRSDSVPVEKQAGGPPRSKRKPL